MRARCTDGRLFGLFALANKINDGGQTRADDKEAPPGADKLGVGVISALDFAWFLARSGKFMCAISYA